MRNDTRISSFDTHSDTRVSSIKVSDWRISMQNKTYSISELSKVLDQSKQVVRRRIDSLHIEAINRETRAFPNEPLKYDLDSYEKLANSFGVEIDESFQNDDTQQHAKTHDDDTQRYAQHAENNVNQEVIIEILERELKHSKEKLSKAEQEKEKLYQLLDQQQQLSLSDRNKINSLELELNNQRKEEIEFEDDIEIVENEKQESTEKKKGFFSRWFGS